MLVRVFAQVRVIVKMLWTIKKGKRERDQNVCACVSIGIVKSSSRAIGASGLGGARGRERKGL